MNDNLANEIIDIIDELPIFLRRTGMKVHSSPEYGPILILLEDSSMTLGEIARSLSVRAPTASVRLEELLIKGYVSKKTSQKDGRSRIFSLTNFGYRMLHEERSRRSSRIENLLSDFSTEERAELLRAALTMMKFFDKSRNE